MSELWVGVGGRNAITVRLEPNGVRGRDMAGQPALSLPLQMQLLPTGEQTNVEYTLVRLTGKVSNQHLGEFASFDIGPIAEAPNPGPFFRPQEALVVLDQGRVKRFEDARGGNDAFFQITLSGLAWLPAVAKFELTHSPGLLEVKIPKSVWAEQVLANWNVSRLKLVEIVFPAGETGEHFRDTYARVEEAERHFANGQYKEALTSVRQSFEELASKLGFEGRVKDSIEHLFADAHPEKKQKAVEALFALYRFLHLGPHAQASCPDMGGEAVVTRRGARFALTMALAVFEYVTPQR